MIQLHVMDIGLPETRFSVAGQRVVVMGAARSGIAAALLLAEQGATVTLTDLRPALADEAQTAQLRAHGVELELGGHVLQTLLRTSLIIVSPGVPLSQPELLQARRAAVPIMGELELASRWLRGRIIAITGTKGKSTTTALTGRMLDVGGTHVEVGGNIGVPLSAQVATSTADTIHVVEVSSFQLETIETFHPWIAVVLNFSPDHLDRHTSVEEYANAKARIVENQNETDWVVINADDPQTLALTRAARSRRLYFSADAAMQEGVVVLPHVITYRRDGRDEPLIPRSAVKLIGRHLVADVAAAAAVAKLVGISAAAMTRAVESFHGLEHALELVAEVQGVRFVNDSKATNVESALRAIESFGDGLVVILGGHYKGGDFGMLRDPLASRHASAVALGETRPLVRRALEPAVPVFEATSMTEAVRQAFERARPNGTVLLAPACSSFDMFVDYADRGRAFKRAVADLEAEADRRV